jgi:hypothetical protein
VLVTEFREGCGLQGIGIDSLYRRCVTIEKEHVPVEDSGTAFAAEDAMEPDLTDDGCQLLIRIRREFGQLPADRVNS